MNVMEYDLFDLINTLETNNQLKLKIFLQLKSLYSKLLLQLISNVVDLPLAHILILLLLFELLLQQLLQLQTIYNNKNSFFNSIFKYKMQNKNK